MSHRDELCAILEQALATNDTAHWHARLTEAGVPAAPVADVADVANAPQTEALGMIQHLDHPTIPDLRLTALPLSFDGERALYPSAPPAVGEHTAEILGEAGLRARRDRGPGRRRSDPAMSHVSASFSATIRVRLADCAGRVRAARERDRRGRRLARGDRPRPRREGHQGARRHGRRIRRRPPRADRRERPRRSRASRSSTSRTARS